MQASSKHHKARPETKSLNKWVLNFLFLKKVHAVSTALKSNGESFKSLGATTSKTQSPFVLEPGARDS